MIAYSFHITYAVPGDDPGVHRVRTFMTARPDFDHCLIEALRRLRESHGPDVHVISMTADHQGATP